MLAPLQQQVKCPDSPDLDSWLKLAPSQQHINSPDCPDQNIRSKLAQAKQHVNGLVSPDQDVLFKLTSPRPEKKDEIRHYLVAGTFSSDHRSHQYAIEST